MTSTAEAPPKATTIKFAPALGAAVRLLAAINGLSAAELIEDAIRDYVIKNGKDAPKIERKNTAGRPPQSVQAAAVAVMRLRPDKKDSIPTRLHHKTYRAFDRLTTRKGVFMNEEVSGTVMELVAQSKIQVVREVAGLDGYDAHNNALAQVVVVANGGVIPPGGWRHAP